MSKIHSYIVGWNNQLGKVEVYLTESDASLHSTHWVYIEAESRKESKEQYLERYSIAQEE